MFLAPVAVAAPASAATETGRVAVSGTVRDIAVDPGSGRVFAGVSASPQDGGNRVLAITGGAVVDQSNPMAQFNRLELDPQRARLYVVARPGGNFDPSTISVIDANTLDPITSTQIAGDVIDLAVDAASGNVFLVNGTTNRLLVIDGPTMAQVASVPVTDGQPIQVVVDGAGRAYVTGQSGTGVTVHEPPSYAVTATIPVTNATRSDLASGRLFVGSQVPDAGVVVIDATTHARLGTIDVGGAVFSVVASADGNHVFAVVDGFPRRIAVVDVASMTMTGVLAGLTDPQAFPGAVDPSAGLVYLGDGDNGNPPHGAVVAIHAADATGPVPAVSAVAATVEEGDPIPSSDPFGPPMTQDRFQRDVQVHLSAPSTEWVQVDYTVGPPGSATPNGDYYAPGPSQELTLLIAPGQTVGTATVTTIADTIHEPAETLTLTLLRAVGATIGTATASVTIADDDPLVPHVGAAGDAVTSPAYTSATVGQSIEAIDFDNDGLSSFAPIPDARYAAQGILLHGLDGRDVGASPWAHSPPFGAQAAGYNTSAYTGNYGMEFTNPAASVGFFVNDLEQDAAVSVTTSDGRARSFVFPTTGGASVTRFVGFTADANVITRLDVTTPDLHILDDVRVGRIPALPGVSGRVTDSAGNALAGIRVSASSAGAYAETDTDSDGKYHLAPATSGYYAVKFQDFAQRYSVEWWNDAGSVFAATAISFTTGQAITGIDATLSETTISGRVTDTGGHGIGGITVGAESPEWYAEAISASDGTYTLRGLQAGSYTLAFRDNANQRYSVEWWNDQPHPATAAPIQVTRGDALTGIDATLSETTISGRVTDTGGHGIGGITVAAYSGEWYAEAISASDGTYTLRGLQAESYTLAFRDNANQRYSVEWWNDQPSAAGAVPINVTRGDALTGIDATLSETTISGRVTDTAGDGIGGISVSANSPQWYAETISAPDGTYTLRGLQAESYFLLFQDVQNSKYQMEFWDDQPTQPTAAHIVVARGDVVTGRDATLVTADSVAPTASLTTPSDGAAYSLGQPVTADYSCADETAVASCNAAVPSGAQLGTSVAGTHTFTVTAVDFGGNVTTASATYDVLAGTVEQEASGGDVVTTDPGGQGASPEVPVQTEIVVPEGVDGTISASAQPAGADPSGFQLFDTQIALDGPPAVDAEHPYTVSFTVDASQLDGAAPESIQIFRNGVALQPCTSPTAAEPDPCMVSAAAAPDGSGDAIVTVRTVHFSIWTLGLLDAAVTAAPVSYGTVNIGSSASATVRVTSSGGVPARISGVSIGGPNAADFAVTSETCTSAGALVVGQGCDVTVKATPHGSGPRSAVLRVAHNGAASPTEVPLSVTGRDVTAPDTTITARPPATSNDTTPTFAFVGSEPGTFQCRVDAGPWSSCTSPHTTAPLADGQHTFQVRAVDTAGNIDASPASATYTMQPTCSLLRLQLLGLVPVCVFPVRT